MMKIYSCDLPKNDEYVKSLEGGSVLTKREIYFMTITDIIKISLFDLHYK